MPRQSVRKTSIIFLLSLLAIVCACATIKYTGTAGYVYTSALAHNTVRARSDADTVRILSLNLAHGRGKGLHQILSGEGAIQKNLAEIAAVIKREDITIAALQEADAPSLWSGNFNHVEYLLEQTQMTAAYQGLHVRGAGLQYGTAILADRQLDNPASYRLDGTLLTPAKGFVISTVTWPGRVDFEVDLVSVHLDFLSAETRRRQVETMVEVLRTHNHPVIIMGDFNSEWQSDDGVLDYLSEALDLAAYQPANMDIITYPRFNKRLDWILISRPLVFKTLAVIPDVLSDHRAMVAEIALGDRDAAEKLN